MNRYIAIVECKSIEPSGITGYATYGFGLASSPYVDVIVRNTYSHFELHKEYTIVISERDV